MKSMDKKIRLATARRMRSLAWKIAAGKVGLIKVEETFSDNPCQFTYAVTYLEGRSKAAAERPKHG